MKRFAVASILLTFTFTVANAQNWPQFRGPGATGVNEGLAKPAKFDAPKSENLRWKTPIPGLSHASPVVWGNKVSVVSAVTGGKDGTRFGLYGDSAPVKEGPEHAWEVYTRDNTTGQVLGERIAYEGIPKFKRRPKS